MRSCDALVVGGGPGGSSCARELVRAGMDVMVVDRAVFPRPKVCAGWITPPVVESLEIDLAEYARGRVLQPITGFRTGLIGRPCLETRYREVVSYGIRRCELDHYLLARSGARLVTGVPVSRVERRAGVWVVNGELQAPLLVGAGGHFCPVARRLGGGGAGEPIVAAQEIELPLAPDEQRACRVDPETPELYFAPDLRGYGWCFRKQDYLNVGFGRQGSRAFGAHVRAFVEFLSGAARVPPSALRRWRGHAYLLYDDRARRLFADGVLLVGDAAGLAYAASGEGIRTAVESGMIAARVALRAEGDYGEERLAAYERELAARFGAPSAPRLPAAWTRGLGRRLLASPWATRRLVLDRWFLHRQQPALEAAVPSGAPPVGGIRVGHAPGHPRPPSRRAPARLH